MADTPLSTTTPPASQAPAPTAAPGEPPALAAAPEWAKDWNLAPEVGDWISKAGFKTPADFASSALATKKMTGHKPEDVIIKPKDGDTTALTAALRALGAPEKPEDYGLTAPEGTDGEFLKTATTWFAELGVPKGIAAGLAGKWNEYVGQAEKAQAEAFEQQAATDVVALKKEWGDNFDRNATAARAARDLAGLTPEQGTAIEQALGVAAATKVFAKLGEHLVEAAFKGGTSTASQFGAGTVEAARAELALLRADKGFVTRWNAGDVDARKRIDALNATIAAGMPDMTSAQFRGPGAPTPRPASAST